MPPCILILLYFPRQLCPPSVTPKEVPSMARWAQELRFLLLPVFAGKAKPLALAVSMLVVPTITVRCEVDDEPCSARQDRGEW